MKIGNQEEWQSKLGSGQCVQGRKVNATKVTLASGTIQQTKEQDGQHLVEIREIRSEISALKQNGYNHRSPGSQPRGRGRSRGCGQSFSGIHSAPRSCKSCADQGLRYSCKHCYQCGSFEHFRFHCPSLQQQENRNQLLPVDEE